MFLSSSSISIWSFSTESIHQVSWFHYKTNLSHFYLNCYLPLDVSSYCPVSGYLIDAIVFFTVTGNYPSEPFTPFSLPPFDDTLPEEIPTDGTITTTTTSTTTNGNSKERIYNELNDKLIPIYSSILAAVVVGLVAFIIFKRWRGRVKSILHKTVLQIKDTGF